MQLSAWQRRRLPRSAFAIPERRAYPYRHLPGGRANNEQHARNALARVAQHGTQYEQARVRRAVTREYPDIDVEA